MAYTVVSALIGSLLLSLTLVPLLCYAFMRHGVTEKENFLVRGLKRLYRPLLEGALRRRYVVIGIASRRAGRQPGDRAAAGQRVSAGTQRGRHLGEPHAASGNLVERGFADPPSRARDLECLRRSHAVISQAGRPEDGTDPKPVNMAELFVDLKPESEWHRKISKEALIEEMNQALEKLPGIEPSFSQPIRDNVLESISQIDGQIVVKLFSSEPDVLRVKTREILRDISGVRGVARAFIDRAGETPQLQIEIDRERAARYGLNVADIEDVIETAIGGKEATADLGRRKEVRRGGAARRGCAQQSGSSCASCRSTRPTDRACRCRTWRTSA